jgi:hypothetical protein
MNVVSPRARVRQQPSRRKRNGAIVTGITAAFLAMGFTFIASSILGNTLLEQSRRDRIRSVERTKDARTEVAQLRRVLNSMTSMDSVDRWAVANNLVLSGSELPTLSPVAPAPNAEAQSIVVASRQNQVVETASVVQTVAMASELMVDTENAPSSQ